MPLSLMETSPLRRSLDEVRRWIRPRSVRSLRMRDRLEGNRNTISASWVTSTSWTEARVRSTRHCGSVMSWARSTGRTRAITASRARIRIAGRDLGTGCRRRSVEASS